MIALDVGTRSIVLLEYEGRKIIRAEYAEHTSPCMREGNVYDLSQAVESIKRMREELGFIEGTEVSVAIAGGMLSTKKINIKLKKRGPWSEKDLIDAENNAAAKFKARSKKILISLLRTNFRIDGAQKGSIIGLDGEKAEYEIIATFLPLESVKMKLLAIEKAGFSPNRISVEPLAVSKAIFGDSLPSSPYAIIDIGAGTSDIAIVSSIGLLGVASIPFAGDTITNEIASGFGTDYITADRIKRGIEEEAKDLWGGTRKIEFSEVEEKAASGVEILINAISQKISDIMGEEKVRGIILVGGGSLFRTLPQHIADSVGLPSEKVRVRNSETISGIEDSTGKIKGPAFVTAIGIMLSREESFIPVHFTLNGKNIFSIENPSRRNSFNTVSDLLMFEGIDPIDLFGEPGKAKVIKGKIIGGEPGEPPKITINGRTGVFTLDSVVTAGAVIFVEKGNAGKDALLEKIEGSIPNTQLSNSQTPQLSNSQTLKGYFIINGERKEFDRTDDDVLMRLDQIISFPLQHSLKIKLNGEDKVISDKTARAWVGEKRVDSSYKVPWGSVIKASRSDWYVYEIFETINYFPKEIKINNSEAGLDSIIKENDEVVVR